jgi:hypothetical protein
MYAFLYGALASVSISLSHLSAHLSVFLCFSFGYTIEHIDN